MEIKLNLHLQDLGYWIVCFSFRTVVCVCAVLREIYEFSAVFCFFVRFAWLDLVLCWSLVMDFVCVVEQLHQEADFERAE